MTPEPGHKIDRGRLNFLVDLAAALSMLGMILTGYVLRFPLPPGTNRTSTLYGLSRHDWGDIHFWCSVCLLAVLAAHVALHWQWVVSTARRRMHLPPASPSSFGRTGALTILILAAFLAGFSAATHVAVKQRETPLHAVSELRGPVAAVREGSGRKSESATSVASSAPSSVKFWEDVYPIFEASCFGCHGAKRARGNFRADRPDDYFGRNGAKPFVIPKDSLNSPLVAIISGQKKDMPMAEAHHLSELEISKIKQWIDAGAEWPEHPPAN